MDIKIIYEDKDLLVVDKPAGLVVFPEGQTKDGTLIDELIKEKPELAEVGLSPRYGMVHRLDKDTSGVLLVAKSTQVLNFLQKQFINKRVEKRYITLVQGNLENNSGTIKTLILRSKKDFRKQEAACTLPIGRQAKSAREAITKYKVIKRYKDYTLVQVEIETGRRHQIRCHFSYLKHPVVGDKLYSFKNAKTPAGLNRQFLHSEYLKINLPNGSIKEFKSNLPEDLKKILDNLGK
jgi:23S rRNA pseudouridine1911/1915/1917 synthase